MKPGGQGVSVWWLGMAMTAGFCRCALGAMEPGDAAAAIRDAISTAGLGERDLRFKKDVVPDANLSPLVKRLLDRPLDLFQAADHFEAEYARPPWERGAGGRTRCPVSDWGRVPAPLRQPLGDLMDALLWHRRRVEGMVRRVRPDLRAASVRALAVEGFLLDRKPQSFSRWAGFTGGAGPLRDLISRAGNLDVGPAEWIGLQLEAGQPVPLSGWRSELDGVLAAVRRFVEIAGPLGMAVETCSIETELGRVRIGGRGADRHPAGHALVVDFGGDDTHESGGEANGLRGIPLSVTVDLGGNDRYRNGALGLWGVGILWDERGDDVYVGGDGALACGIFGAGGLVDREGADHYQGDTLTQGAGVFGWAVLWDEAGNDTYRVALEGQGFAGSNGFGLLADRAGNDSYLAGGKYPDHGRYPDNTVSLSQGVSIGTRPFAPGGVGVLLDGGGNDSYKCEVYGQGCGYWYSFGALIDAGGSDTYEALQYAQGSGIHLSAGLLRDRGGDDRYVNHHGLAQGGCHDFAVGLLWDGDGNDHYSSESGSQGCAIYNAVGVLLDENGDDDYRLTAEPGQGQGNGEWTEKRGIGSVGALLDLGGRDAYSTGLDANAFRARADIGVAVDAPSRGQLAAWRRPWAAPGPRIAPQRFDPASAASKDIGARRPSVASAATFEFGRLASDRPADPPVERDQILALGGDPALEELLLRAVRSSQAEGKIRDSREAMRQLESLPVRRFAALLPWLLRRDVATRVLVDQLIEKKGRDLLPVLRAFAGSRWPDLRNICLYWIGRHGDSADAALAARALREERSSPVALLALSRLGGAGFEPDVEGFLDSRRGLERALAARTLGRVPTPELSRIAALLQDPDWNVRREAAGALGRAGAAGREAASRRDLGPLGRFWADKIGRIE